VQERFARGASARGPGSGLGLALVAQQAALHGGVLEIQDAPAGGARLRLTLARS
jgi:two-component system, OmpR family, sensor histidine kinase PrrB